MLYEKIRPADLTSEELDYYAEHFFTRAVVTRQRLRSLPVAMAIRLRRQTLPVIRKYILANESFNAARFYEFTAHYIESLYFYMVTGDTRWAHNAQGLMCNSSESTVSPHLKL